MDKKETMNETKATQNGGATTPTFRITIVDESTGEIRVDSKTDMIMLVTHNVGDKPSSTSVISCIAASALTVLSGLKSLETLRKENVKKLAENATDFATKALLEILEGEKEDE